MSIFVQKLNPMTGTNTWIMQHEDYDYHQEVARSAFADMLHDTERNRKYEQALKSAIEHQHSLGKKANVLDIGTGTGLLSMMAVRHGADSVTACEAFKPISECAVKVIERNGMAGKITVVPKRSTDLTVSSDNGDLRQKCNILVTEVFDTELIGEGALSTFNHAYKYLLEPESIVVPKSATIYAQIVECPFAQNWNKFKDFYDNDGQLLVRTPSAVRDCQGSISVHDLQLTQLKPHLFKTIAAPVKVFKFDWFGHSQLDESTISKVSALNSGTAQMVFMWWTLEMDHKSEIVLSCAPKFAHDEFKNLPGDIPWRDHWMQAIYYLPKEVTVKKGDVLSLTSTHDEYSLWFNLSHPTSDQVQQAAVCTCGAHVAFSRTRIGQVNDSTRNKKYLQVLEKNVTKETTLLVLSEGFYPSLAALKLGARKIYFIETNHVARQILSLFLDENGLKNQVEIYESIDDLTKECSDMGSINLVLGEPYFLNCILPWDNLLFVYWLKLLQEKLSPDVKIFPKFSVVRGMAMRFHDLNKIRLPLGRCEGFEMKDFDNLIKNSCSLTDNNVEAQPLWEYPGIALSEPVDIIKLDLLHFSPTSTNMEETGTFSIDKKWGACNGIALWVDWVHNDDLISGSRGIISTGPISPPEIGRTVDWDIYTRQGVCLFENRDVELVNYRFSFNFKEGDMTFKFHEK